MLTLGRTWRAFSRHLRYGLCRHRELVRVHVDGVWYFACACGYRVPMLRRPPRASRQAPR